MTARTFETADLVMTFDKGEVGQLDWQIIMGGKHQNLFA